MPLLPDYRTHTGPARAGVLTDCLSLMFSHLLHRCRPLVATEPLSKGRGPQMAGSKTTDRRSTKVTLLKLLLMFSSNCYCVFFSVSWGKPICYCASRNVSPRTVNINNPEHYFAVFTETDPTYYLSRSTHCVVLQ